MKRVRHSFALLLLTGCALAQAGQPLSLTMANGVWQGNNTTSKEILAYVVVFQNPHYTLYSHDYFFKPHGVLSGAVERMEMIENATESTLVWVQFADGTEWGDHTAGQSILNQRGPLLQEMNAMISAYTQGGDKGLSDYIASLTDSYALSMARQQKRAGVDGVLGRLKVNLASAAQHATAGR